MSSDSPGRVIAVGLSVVVAVVVGAGLYLVGSPGTAREQALDERRVRDLREAQDQVTAYWKRHRSLPAVLADAATSADDSAAQRDPVTGDPYEYRVTGDTTYEVCAVFAHPTRDARSEGNSWRHLAGRHCYSDYQKR